MSTEMTRRSFLNKASMALLAIPILSFSAAANAKTNPAVRAQLKYQDLPKDKMDCRTCLEFIAGKTDKDLGACNVIPGDDEISPNGYCTKWNTM
ncbi:MAG: high-potential iron-sulfur protein [Gallionellaceae bacterium]|jgi:hypothetical protein